MDNNINNDSYIDNVEVNNDSYIDNVEVNNETDLDDKNTEEEKFNWKKEILSWVKIFVVAFLVATILDNFIIMNANVPSGSMEKTIMTGDRMIGNRLAYINSDPERGDVIIFKFPDDESQFFVKRIIGLPGEKVTIKEGKVYINDSETPLEEPYLPEEWTTLNDDLEYTVPTESYFVMGDNRNHSNDARLWTNTFVKKDAILAKASFIYWPFSDWGTIDSAEYSIDK